MSINKGSNFTYKDGTVVSVVNIQGDRVVLSDGNNMRMDRINDLLTPINNNVNYGNNLYNDYINESNIYNNINATHNAQSNRYPTSAPVSNLMNENYLNNIASQLMNLDSNSYNDDHDMGGVYAKDIVPVKETEPFADNVQFVPELKTKKNTYGYTPNGTPIVADFADYEGMSPEEIAIMQKSSSNYTNPGVNKKPLYSPNGELINNMHNNAHHNTHTPTMYNNFMSPAKEVLNKIKRNYEIDFKFSIKTNIPNLEFLKLTQENLDCDIFEALADEITEYLLQNPKVLQKAILGQLKGNEMIEMFKTAKKIEPKIEKPVKEKKSKKSIIIENKIDQNTSKDTLIENNSKLSETHKYPKQESEIETVTPEIIK